MSIAQTFTVTVVSTGGGNKYFIDGVQQDSVMIGAGLTYKFDQSDSSNENHPLRFSSDSGNSTPYTVGVTAVGTPGNSGAYTQIDVQNGAPSTLYITAQTIVEWAVKLIQMVGVVLILDKLIGVIQI